MKTTYEIHAKHSGTIDEISGKVPAVPYSLQDVLTSLSELAFIAETVAHLRGMEKEILPTSDKARAILAALKP